MPNDMLNLQIICTFNVKVKELDKALLRPKADRTQGVQGDDGAGCQQASTADRDKAYVCQPATLAEVYSFDRNKTPSMTTERKQVMNDVKTGPMLWIALHGPYKNPENNPGKQLLIYRQALKRR